MLKLFVAATHFIWFFMSQVRVLRIRNIIFSRSHFVGDVLGLQLPGTTQLNWTIIIGNQVECHIAASYIQFQFPADCRKHIMTINPKTAKQPKA